MKHVSPPHDGSKRMNPLEVRHAMKARVIALKERGMKQKDIAAHFGISQQRVSQLVRMDLPEEDSLHSRARLCPQRHRIIALAKEATSLNHLYRLSGRGRSFVVTTLTLFAPGEYHRLRGGVKPEPAPEPAGGTIDRYAHYLAQGFDEDIARGMAKLAEWESSTTRVEEGPLRIVPPGRITSPRVDEAAA